MPYPGRYELRAWRDIGNPSYQTEESGEVEVAAVDVDGPAAERGLCRALMDRAVLDGEPAAVAAAHDVAAVHAGHGAPLVRTRGAERLELPLAGLRQHDGLRGEDGAAAHRD